MRAVVCNTPPVSRRVRCAMPATGRGCVAVRVPIRRWDGSGCSKAAVLNKAKYGWAKTQNTVG